MPLAVLGPRLLVHLDLDREAGRRLGLPRAQTPTHLGSRSQPSRATASSTGPSPGAASRCTSMRAKGRRAGPPPPPPPAARSPPAPPAGSSMGEAPVSQGWVQRRKAVSQLGELLMGSPFYRTIPSSAAARTISPGRGRRQPAAVAAVLDDHADGDPPPTRGTVGREADEPGVRALALHLGGAGLAGDRRHDAAQGSAAAVPSVTTRAHGPGKRGGPGPAAQDRAPASARSGGLLVAEHPAPLGASRRRRATVAATRAIWNGVAITWPWP